MNGGLSVTSFISSQLQSGFNLHMWVLLNNTEGFLLALCKCAGLRQMSGGREKRIHVSVLTVCKCATVSVFGGMCVCVCVCV